MKYVRPDVKDYGDLVSITADGAVMTHLGFGTLAAVSSPLVPSAGASAAPAGDTAATLGSGGEGGGDGVDVAGTTASGPGSGSGAGVGGSAAGGGGGGGGGLAFTGFPAAVVGAVGAGMAAAGAAARKYLARR